MKRIILYLFFVLTVFCLCSCKNNGSTYFVDFVTNCEVEIDDMVIKEKNTAFDLPNISRVGYNLDGWYTDEKFESEMKKGSLINKDYTLYAKWSRDYTNKLVQINGTTLYIDETGDLYTWGCQNFSELFFERTKITNEPTHILNGMKFKHIAVTDTGYLLLIASNGYLYHYGKLYNYEFSDKLELISNEIKFKFASVSRDYVLAVSEDDNLYGWGKNAFSCIGGNQSFYESPHQLTNESHILTCANTDNYNSSFVTVDGYLYTWGNVSDCVGHPEINRPVLSISTPKKILELENIIDVYMKASTFAIDKDGVVYGFGRNEYGQLGIGNIHPYNDLSILTATKVDRLDEPIGKVCNFGGKTFFISETGKLYVSGDISTSKLNENYGLEIDDIIYYFPHEIELDFKIKNLYLKDSLTIIDENNNIYTAGKIDYTGNDGFSSFLTPYKLDDANIQFKQTIFYRDSLYGIDGNNTLYQYYGGNIIKVLDDISFISMSSLEYPYNGLCVFAIDIDGHLYVKGNFPVSTLEYKEYDDFTQIHPNYSFQSVEGWYAITTEGDVFNVVTGNILYEGMNIKTYIRTQNATLALDEEGNLWGKGSNTYGELFTWTTEKVTTFSKIDFDEPIKKISCTTNYVEILTEDGNLYHCGKNTNGVITLIDTGVIDSYKGYLYIKENRLYTAFGGFYKADPDHYIDTGVSKVFFEEEVNFIYANRDVATIITNNGSVYVWGCVSKSIFIKNFNNIQRELIIIKEEN